MLQRSIVMALLMLLATPAAAEWHLPCLFGLLGGCSTVIPLSREYAARPVQPLNPQAALEEVNALAQDLENYHLFHAIRGELLRDLSEREQARASALRALKLTHNSAEQFLLTRRLLEW